MWLPIETAPKILWHMVLGCTAGDPDSVWPMMWKFNDRIQKAYWGDVHEWDDYDCVESPPTHWLPIPTVPGI